MRGDVHLYAAPEDAFGVKVAEDGVDLLGPAGEHAGRRGVAHCQDRSAAPLRDQRLDALGRQLYRGHRPLTAGGTDQPAAAADDPGGVVEVEDSGHVSGRDFSHGMPDHGVGLEAPGSPQAGERDLYREDRRLGHIDLGEAGGLRGGVELGGQ